MFGKFDFEDIIPPNTKISLTIEDWRRIKWDSYQTSIEQALLNFF
jgi:hypothetical protein